MQEPRPWRQRGILWLLLAVLCLSLGLLLFVQLRAPAATQPPVAGEGWEFVVADLVDSNARLREEIESLRQQLANLQDVEGGGALLESLVVEVNHLRTVNGLVEVSGPGVQIVLVGPVTALDLYDLINELRNAGAEALTLNGRRIVAWSAIGTDGEHVTVDGQPIRSPYRLQAIGDDHTLEVAMLRPGGLVSLLQQANRGISITVEQRETLTLPVYDLSYGFAYARLIE